jgi:hypothetical protein
MTIETVAQFSVKNGKPMPMASASRRGAFHYLIALCVSSGKPLRYRQQNHRRLVNLPAALPESPASTQRFQLGR